MNKNHIDDFMKLKKEETILLNKLDCSEYKDMVKDIKSTPVGEFNNIVGSGVDILFVGIVKSIKKTTTGSGKLLGRLVFQDCSGELSILLFKNQIEEIYMLDLSLPIKMIVYIRAESKDIGYSPGYRFVSATYL